MYSPTLYSSQKTWSFGFPIYCKVLCWAWGLWLSCISGFLTCFNMDVFCHLVYWIHSTSTWISLRGNWSFVVVYSVHLWEEGKSGSSYPAILVHVQNKRKQNKAKLPLSLCMFFGSAFSMMLGLAMWLAFDNDTIKNVVQAKLSSCALQLFLLWQHQGFLETYL